MPATKQSQAVNAANALANLMVSVQSLRTQAKDFVQQYSNQSYVAVWNALPTAPVNADGSLGTADGSPVTSNPIDTRIVTALNKSVSATGYANAEAVLTAFLTMLDGSAAVAQLNRGASVDALAAS